MPPSPFASADWACYQEPSDPIPKRRSKQVDQHTNNKAITEGLVIPKYALMALRNVPAIEDE
jgi:hypothetical protein